MKKLLLFTVASIAAFTSIAQKHAVVGTQKLTNSVNGTSLTGAGSLGKTTAAGDTLLLNHIGATDTPVVYYCASRDSGYVSGTDAYGDKGFAERYDFGTADSSLNVVGVTTIFTGKVKPTSTKTITFYTWKAGAQALVAPHVYNSGFPFTKLDSVTVPITRLGVRSVDTVGDTLRTYWFTTPSGYLNQSFFVGCVINYTYAGLAGDTIGIYTNHDGDRTSSIYDVNGSGDTIINNQAVTMYADGSWHDNATDNFQVWNNYYLFPVVIVHRFLSVNGLTNKNFTFYGNYPNPCTTSTNIKFAVANTTDVNVTIMDMSGRIVRTMKEANLSAGEHMINLDTKGLNAGDYTYVIRTTNGGGVASKITIVN